MRRPASGQVGDRLIAMSDLLQLYDVIGRCTDCDLCLKATRAVPGEGPADARIMFIGEGPGQNEDRTGRPFVGAAGQFLDRLLASINLKRSDVYITNVVKHRPPNNRDPLPGEIEACRKYLDRQIELIRPRLIVTLGRYSMARWFPGQSISRIHGQPRVFDGVTVVPMFHPAAALHQERYRSLIEADFKRLTATLAQAMAAQREPKPVPVAAGPAPAGQPVSQVEAPSVGQMRLF